MKQIFYVTLSVAGLLLFSSCGSDSKTNQSDSLVEIQNVPEHVFDFKENGYTGTFQFTDEKGVTCTIVLKGDGTMTAQSSKSDGVKTGTWVTVVRSRLLLWGCCKRRRSLKGKTIKFLESYQSETASQFIKDAISTSLMV